MLEKTNHHSAPWHVIRSNDKHQARIEAMKLILNHFDYEGRNENLSFVYNEKIVKSAEKELEMMRHAKPHLYGVQ